MVPFWVPTIIRHPLFRVPKRDLNFDNHPYMYVYIYIYTHTYTYCFSGLSVSGTKELMEFQSVRISIDDAGFTHPVDKGRSLWGGLGFLGLMGLGFRAFRI